MSQLRNYEEAKELIKRKQFKDALYLLLQIETQSNFQTNSQNLEIIQNLFEIYDEFHFYGQIIDLYSKYTQLIQHNFDLTQKYLLLKYKYKDYLALLKEIVSLSDLFPDTQSKGILSQILTKTKESILNLQNYLKESDPSKENYSGSTDVKSVEANYLLIAIYCWYIHEYPTSERYVALALKTNTSNQVSLLLYGIVKMMRSDFKTAIKMFDIYSKYVPDIWLASLARSYCYFGLNDKENMLLNWKSIPLEKFILRDLKTPEIYFQNPLVLQDIFGITLNLFQNLLEIS